MRWYVIVAALLLIAIYRCSPMLDAGESSTNYVSSGSSSSAPAKSFGLYRETGPVNVIWDTTATMDVWNDSWNTGGCGFASDPVNPEEGAASLIVTAIAGKSWYGIGFSVKPTTAYTNLSFLTNWTLKFWYKSNFPITKVGLKSGAATESWVFGSSCIGYGLLTNGSWSEVSIPMTAFSGIDFTQISQYFMIVADGANYITGNTWNLDNICYTNMN